jgi:transcriptional regulator with XRE-family HTH domain
MPNAVLPAFATFGDMLKYLRRRARLTQRELAIAVDYSESQISRLEQNERLPDATTVLAVFVPALGLEKEPDTIAHLLALAKTARGQPTAGEQQTLPGLAAAAVTQTPDAGILGKRGQLPVQPTPFLGRETELTQIVERLADPTCRLLTLIGPGGIGKTCLALQAALLQRGSFHHLV